MEVSKVLSAIVEVPTESDSLYPFASNDVAMVDDKCMFLPLEEERTEAGRGLVRAMWFDKAVYLWTDGLRYTLTPWRCHIVGDIFSSFYIKANRESPARDIACVWEMHITASENAPTPPPSPQPLHLTTRSERHLDNLALHNML